MIALLTTILPTAYYSNQGEGSLTGMFGHNTGLWLIILGSMVASWLVSSTLKRRFEEYSRMPMPMTGAEAAERMLRDNKITGVKVISTEGRLTDHYNPVDKTVNLSESVYGSNSVAAVAVAAHEVGHAVQHANAYAWLGFRSRLVPVVQISSGLVQIVLLIGVALVFFMQSTLVLGIGVVLLGVLALFSVVTLPVEFDASRRALVWMQRSAIGNYLDQEKAKNALFWAAMTYVVAALSSVAMFLHYLFLFLGARREE